MKFAKKMRLVECIDNDQNRSAEPNIHTINVKDEDYLTPKPLQNLDKEMETILNDTTTDINQKWTLYHQTLQRYLGLIKRMRYGDHNSSTDVHAIAGGNTPSSTVLNNDLDEKHIRTGVSRTTSTPKNNSKQATTPELPIRIRKRILRNRNQSLQKKTKRRISGDLVASMLYDVVDSEDDDDNFYLDVNSHLASDIDDEGDTTPNSFTKKTPTVVDGWSSSNITS